MNTDYKDIRGNINKSPTWWDEHAVPRYCEFSPREIANIYADECILLLITCQGCDKEYKVAMSRAKHSVYEMLARQVWPNEPRLSLGDGIKTGSIYYGDPPNTDCCVAGASMNCNNIKVLEYWHRDKDTKLKWIRDKSLEISLYDD